MVKKRTDRNRRSDNCATRQRAAGCQPETSRSAPLEATRFVAPPAQSAVPGRTHPVSPMRLVRPAPSRQIPPVAGRSGARVFEAKERHHEA